MNQTDDQKETEYEFWSYEGLEEKLKELDNNHSEFCVTVRRVMAGGRFFVTVELESDEEDTQ